MPFERSRVVRTAGVALILLLAAACSNAVAPATPGPAPSPDPLASLRQDEAYGADGSAGDADGSRSQSTRKPTGAPPPLDTSIANVSLGEVFFDTFRGGSVSLSRATVDLVGRLRDAIIPIYEPLYDGPEGGDWLDDDDLVLGYESETGAYAYAYPVKMLNLHELVNDVIDGEPVLVSYCPLCASGVVYSRVLDGRELLFGNTSALYESDLVMFDWETGSYWYQVIGEAIVGPLTGRRLTLLPSRMTMWAQWKRLHPDTRVLSKDLGLLGGGIFGGYDERVNAGGFAFPVSAEKLDDRLRPGTMVLVVEVDGRHAAYPLSSDAPTVVNDTVGGRPIVVLTDPAAPGGVAFFGEVAGEALTFERTADGVIRDLETGTSWDETGRAVAGELSGSVLRPVPARTSFWFSIVGAVPGIALRLP